MSNFIRRLPGVHEDAGRTTAMAGWWRVLSPLAAPFLIVACAPRWEMLAAAACWGLLVLPGALAVDVLFPPAHPFGRTVARPAVASLLGLFPFSVVCLAGCLLHWTLTPVLIGYVVLYSLCTAWLLRVIVHRGRAGKGADEPWPALDLLLDGPRWTAGVVAGGIAALLVGIALATVQTSEPQATPGFWGARAYWWQGTLVGAAGSLLAAAGIAMGLRGPVVAVVERQTAPDRNRMSRRRAGAAPPGPSASGSWLAVLLWLAAAGLTWHTMLVAYRLPAANLPKHMHRPNWNSDDVTYVSEAVDYRYGAPLGLYESSIGSRLPMNWNNLSPLVAPLVATLSRITGIECAALHHSVLPPLVILLGMSAAAALLMVVFRMHRWAVPLGLLVIAMSVHKSWEYERSVVEFTVWRAMQTKSVHLWMVYPLQLAGLLVLLFRPNQKHLFLSAACALVAHAVHPFATILGAAWSATACAASAVGHRRALPGVLIVLACYGALGGAQYYAASRQAKPAQQVASGHLGWEPEQSRDLVRVDNRPIPRQDPRILFGWDCLFNLGAVAIPLVLVMGWRHREFLLPGLLGVVAVLGCNSAFLGGFISRALPTAILWRFRWVLPWMAQWAIVSFALYWAVCVLLRRHDRTTTPVRSFLACLAVVGAFAGMLAASSAYAIKPGPPPARLSKFAEDFYGLPGLLGGVEAASFVWGPETVGRELPQLMPNLKLVLSRDSIMLPAKDPEFRQLVLLSRAVFYLPPAAFKRGQAPPDAYLANLLARLTGLYPIDHVVLEYAQGRGEQGARVLQGAGWQRVGRSGTYEVWRRASP